MSKFVIVTGLLILTVLLACDRYIATSDPARSAPTPIPLPIDVVAVVDDSVVTLSWELTDSSGAVLFRVYAAKSEEGEYSLADSTSSFSIALSGLLLNRQAFLRVTTVTSGNVESQPSSAVSASPTYISISVNNDAEYTRQRNIQVRINSGVSALFVKMSEQQDFGDADWENYGVTKSFELSEDNGLKTVYVHLQFDDGSETGQPLSDEITLDTHAEIDTVIFSPDDDSVPMTEGDEAVFMLRTGEIGGEASVSFGSVRNLDLYDDATHGDAAADDGTYTLHYTVPYGAYAFKAVVTGSLIDVAGNRADDVNAATLMNINSTPEPVVLAVSFGVNDSTVVFTWTNSLESDFESYRLMKVGPPDTTLMIATSASTNRFEMSTPVSNQDYFIYVFDHHGDSAASDTVAAP